MCPSFGNKDRITSYEANSKQYSVAYFLSFHYTFQRHKNAKKAPEIEKLTENIRKLRKEAGLCDGIATRSGVIKEKMKTIQQEKVKEKEEVSYEHIRRSR